MLDRAAAGEPAYALLVGEPGIGKSRLVEGLADHAADAGSSWPPAGAPRTTEHRRCGRGARPSATSRVEDGRPLGSRRRAPAQRGHRHRRRLRGRRAAGVPGVGEHRATRCWPARRTTPLLLVLEDLHWADTASLRVLRRLLASTAPGQRLAARRHPPPVAGADRRTGRGRRGARAAPRGTSRPRRPERDRGRIARGRGGRRQPPTPTSCPSWHARSEGNPFFLIELARLGTDAGAGDAIPATVRDVIARRFETLPEQTRSLLLLAAVLGRRCSLDVLAAVAEESVDDVDDALVPAREAGLVVEPEAGTVAFTHALTRDAVTATTTASRVARLHARVAHGLSDGGAVAGLVGHEERVAELARHWLAAGPSYAAHAWRAAVEAAEQARRTFSWVEAEQLVAAAIEAHRRDPLGTAEERIDLLLTRAHDCRPNCRVGPGAPVRRGGDRPGTPRRRTCPGSSLRRRLPRTTWSGRRSSGTRCSRTPSTTCAGPSPGRRPRDSPERCRLMLALAVQLYYDPRRPRRARGAGRGGLRHGAADRRPGAALVGRPHRVEGAVDPGARGDPAVAGPGGPRRDPGQRRRGLRGGGARGAGRDRARDGRPGGLRAGRRGDRAPGPTPSQLLCADGPGLGPAQPRRDAR